ncbi:N-acyl homoserine lactonase family protein [Phytohabitans flavus]|uniref:N-acyl homoserine lactonase family protein n=1 Tax=Phytohabitans flavus TaxID=1076124 RepID=UPI00363123EE
MAEVLAVRYGTRAARKSEVFLHFDMYGEPDADIQMDYYFWVLRLGGQTILVDCGFNEASGGRRRRTMLCPPSRALSRLGIDPGTITTIVVTHGHYDHIGNLPDFPDARLVMARREYDFWTSPMGGKPLFAVSAETDDVAALHAAHDEGRIEFFTTHTSLPGGVDLVEVGGHTQASSSCGWEMWCSPPTRCTTTRSWTRTARSSTSPTCRRCTRGSTCCASSARRTAWSPGTTRT